RLFGPLELAPESREGDCHQPDKINGPLNDNNEFTKKTTALIPKAYSIPTPAATVEEIVPPKSDPHPGRHSADNDPNAGPSDERRLKQ
ncbi:hypothetical protein ACCS78_40830, partial [Rhizobium johnstonii]